MDPIAYHLTWTTYGTWLSGDERGWVSAKTSGIQLPDPVREERCRTRMTAPAVVFSEAQRALVEHTIREHCRIRGWTLHAVNVRTNHTHVVVTGDRDPDEMMKQLKAWCSRRLSDSEGLAEAVAKSAGRRKWFTEGGSKRWIWDEPYLENAIRYVIDGQ